MSKRITIISLIVAIAVAAILRGQHMDNEVKTWQVGNTIMLTTLEIWHQEGMANHYFSPVQTWPNKGDKFHHLYKRLEDKHGNNYYVSLPPMAWWLAHAIFQASGKPPSQIGLQLIGFILQLLGAFAVLGLSLTHYKSWPSALTGFVIFLFYPVLAFGFNYNFFSEIIGLTFWALAAFLAIRSHHSGRDEFSWLLVFANLVFVLTCWTGVFFSFGAILFFLLQKRWKTATVIGISAAFAITLIILFYGSISGIEELWQSWSTRFYERSGMFGRHLSDRGLNITNPNAYRQVFERFGYHMKWLGYGCLLVFAGTLFWVKLRNKQLNDAHNPNSFVPLFFLFFIPAFMHLMVFFNANALHYIYQGKWGLLIAIVAAWTVYKLGLNQSKYPQRIGLAVMLIGLLLSVEIKVPVDHESEKIQALADELRPTLNPNKPVTIEAEIGINSLYLSYLLKRNVVAIDKPMQPSSE